MPISHTLKFGKRFPNSLAFLSVPLTCFHCVSLVRFYLIIIDCFNLFEPVHLIFLRLSLCSAQLGQGLRQTYPPPPLSSGGGMIAAWSRWMITSGTLARTSMIISSGNAVFLLQNSWPLSVLARISGHLKSLRPAGPFCYALSWVVWLQSHVYDSIAAGFDYDIHFCIQPSRDGFCNSEERYSFVIVLFVVLISFNVLIGVPYSQWSDDCVYSEIIATGRDRIRTMWRFIRNISMTVLSLDDVPTGICTSRLSRQHPSGYTCVGR